MISEEQKELANFIKSVHIDLRKNSKINGYEEAWKNHIKKNNLLDEYAKVMNKLANEYWIPNSQNNADVVDRVQWIVNKSEDYFKNNDIFRFREKEIEKENYYSNKGDIKAVSEKFYIKFDVNKLDLLDVGSCYNPFKKYPCFNVLPIDIAPATPDVLKCDFISLNIDKNMINSKCNTIEFLQENSFDLIVFSLLLEYLPSPNQRYLCCEKAYKLLKNEGLLFIITPDSKNSNANSILMKNWRIALGSIGFSKVYYQKFTHIHCIAYRKNINSELTKLWSSKMCVKNNLEVVNLIQIPQDSQNYNEMNITNNQKRNNYEDQIVADSFNELPFLHI